jgi:hypothetical protein
VYQDDTTASRRAMVVSAAGRVPPPDPPVAPDFQPAGPAVAPVRRCRTTQALTSAPRQRGAEQQADLDTARAAADQRIVEPTDQVATVNELRDAAERRFADLVAALVTGGYSQPHPWATPPGRAEER